MITAHPPPAAAAAAAEVSIPQFLPPSLWRHVVDVLELSPQQARIVGLILHGKQDKEIARDLGLSRDTIRTYLRRVFDRLGVESRVGVVLSVFEVCVGQERVTASCHSLV